MKCQYVVISESFSLDVTSGRVSLFHLIDRIPVVSTPFVIPVLNFIALFEQEDGDEDQVPFDLETSINGNVIAAFKQHVYFHDGQKLNRNLSQLQGAIIPEPGILSFRAVVGGEVLGYWNVIIEKSESDDQATSGIISKPKRRKKRKD